MGEETLRGKVVFEIGGVDLRNKSIKPYD